MFRLCLLASALACVFVAVSNGQELRGPQFLRLPPTEGNLPPIDDDPLPAPADAPVLPVEEDHGNGWMFPASWYKPWEGSVELGLNGTEGNSQTFNIRAGGKAKYTQPWVEHTYEMIHVDNSANGVKTALNGFFDGRWVFPFANSPWSYFIHNRDEYDDFRDYDVRVSGDTGLAYDLWKTDFSKLQVRSGFSTSREIGGTNDNFTPELVYGIDLSHKIGDMHKFSLVSDYYPSLEDFADDYRINTSASWEIVVCQSWGLSAKLSAIDRYDNTPQGRKANDINYAALMLWSF